MRALDRMIFIQPVRIKIAPNSSDFLKANRVPPSIQIEEKIYLDRIDAFNTANRASFFYINRRKHIALDKIDPFLRNWTPKESTHYYITQIKTFSSRTFEEN